MALNSNSIISRLKFLLRRDKIKLWEAPYTNAVDLSFDRIPEELIKKYATELTIPEDVISEKLLILHQMTVHRLKAKRKFDSENVATLLLRTPESEIDEFQLPSVEISLSVIGQSLEDMACQKLGLETNRKLTLIAGGNVLDSGKSLHSQDVQNYAEILVLIESKEEQKRGIWMARVQKHKQAALTLIQGDFEGSGSHTLDVIDRHGQPLQLPINEQSALSVGMTLQQKGDAALKNEQELNLALLYYLEADSQFKECREELRQMYDNYAILNLNIVWVYLKLKSVKSLPDAEARLEECETCFNKSYGRNLERVAKIKGNIELERSLLIRLHLLQAILTYYQGNVEEAERKFNRVSEELKSAEIDPTQIDQLMVMGYNRKEARLGLRAAKGRIDEAVDWIESHRKEARAQTEKYKDAKKRSRLAKKLGFCANGSPIPLDQFDHLRKLGYDTGRALGALRDANGNLDRALTLLEKCNNFDNSSSITCDKDTVDAVNAELLNLETTEALHSMGFNLEKIQDAMKKCKTGDLTSVLCRLTDNAAGEGAAASSSPRPSSASSQEEESSAQESSSAEDSATSSSSYEAAESAYALLKDAVVADGGGGGGGEASSSTANPNDDYLDIDLEEERELLQLYQALIKS